MKKSILAFFLLTLIGCVGYVVLNRGPDVAYEKMVQAKVTQYVQKQYGKAQIVEVRPAYADTDESKERRHQIAVKLKAYKQDQYMLYRLKKNKVIELGLTETLPIPKQ
ncbi:MULTISPECIES: hypothetical protein [unclassified Exiguobacterium]|uniref:hypothetical protein n=1 Tax=unclassified Exiguobacterium TaxID=2644629 RepID=UPI000B5876CA|nr:MULTISPECIES: hypothetical protein [unclassified Exiguobacterium]ASI35392.1 hypothetical protein A0126_07410 [Exiguobacterium sp. N4-1P]ASI37405.1 hypothetical protein A0126_17690 [Exiguobacterium sp. N4-1P]